MKKYLLSICVVFLLLSGCSDREEIFQAVGNSEHWEINMNYKIYEDKELDQMMIDVSAKAKFTNENPPNKIKFDMVYPKGFPLLSRGSVEYSSSRKQFELPIGSSNIEKEHTIENLQETVSGGHILIEWTDNGELNQEKIPLKVLNESNEKH